MLTRQQVIDTFITGINEIPADGAIEVYETFTQEQLNTVIARIIAARSDPTFAQRTGEDFVRYMAATPEEQAVWKHIEPNPAP